MVFVTAHFLCVPLFIYDKDTVTLGTGIAYILGWEKFPSVAMLWVYSKDIFHRVTWGEFLPRMIEVPSLWYAVAVCVVLAVCTMGLYQSIRREKYALFFLVVFLAGILVSLVWGEYQDQGTYLIGVFMVVPILWIALGIERILSPLRKGIPLIYGFGVILIGGALAGAIVGKYYEHPYKGWKIERVYAQELLKNLPPHAIIVGHRIERFAALLYAQKVLKVRPDVTVVEYPSLQDKGSFLSKLCSSSKPVYVTYHSSEPLANLRIFPDKGLLRIESLHASPPNIGQSLVVLEIHDLDQALFTRVSKKEQLILSEYFYLKGLTFLQLKKPEAAVAAFRNMTSLEQEAAKLALRWGAIFLQYQRSPSQAKILYQYALSIFPDHKEVLVTLAEMALQEKKLAEAHGYLERLLKLDPKHLSGNLLKATLLTLEKKEWEAREIYEKLIEWYPQEALCYEKYAQALAKSNPHRAQELTKKATEIRKRYPQSAQEPTKGDFKSKLLDPKNPLLTPTMKVPAPQVRLPKQPPIPQPGNIKGAPVPLRPMTPKDTKQK
jgi:tetratricopeptide (TPR) repeat protein